LFFCFIFIFKNLLGFDFFSSLLFNAFVSVFPIPTKTNNSTLQPSFLGISTRATCEYPHLPRFLYTLPHLDSHNPISFPHSMPKTYAIDSSNTCPGGFLAHPSMDTIHWIPNEPIHIYTYIIY